MPQSEPKFGGLVKLLWKNVLKTHPFIALKIILIWVIFSPWFFASLFFSSLKAERWSKAKRCREFMIKNSLAFPGIDPDSVITDSISGGVSNSNHLWHCRKFSGEPVTYFVKVFVPIGTFWAKNLSLVSPFPRIDAITTRERFTVDIVSRIFLAEHGISVPRLVAFDAVEQMLVTEYLEGGNLDLLLQKAGTEKTLSAVMERMIRECGSTLGRIHETGYCLIDTQPINCICTSKGHVYFTDLEFCSQQDKRVWDVGFFLCFLSIRLSGEIRENASRVFLEAYGNHAKLMQADLENVQTALKDYIPTFQTILEIRKYKPEELFNEVLNFYRKSSHPPVIPTLKLPPSAG